MKQLTGEPMRTVYFDKEANARYVVVDGQQFIIVMKYYGAYIPKDEDFVLKGCSTPVEAKVEAKPFGFLI